VNDHLKLIRARTDAIHSAPIEWTSIPFPVKALKMILADLQIQQTNAAGAGAGTRMDDADIDSDDDVCHFASRGVASVDLARVLG
jgi:hypothetical protein